MKNQGHISAAVMATYTALAEEPVETPHEAESSWFVAGAGSSSARPIAQLAR